MKLWPLILCLPLTVWSPPAMAQTADISIELHTDGQPERAARDQLLALLRKYDIERWVYTRKIRIERNVIPHSHPVLTVNTQYLDRDLFALATFLHEQFHWRVDERNDEKAKAAIAEFQRLFPDAPDRTAGGARDRFSTWLHLIVCDLELQALTILEGEDRAREVLQGHNHYKWIYERVLTDPRIRDVNRRFGFILEPRG